MSLGEDPLHSSSWTRGRSFANLAITCKLITAAAVTVSVDAASTAAGIAGIPVPERGGSRDDAAATRTSIL